MFLLCSRGTQWQKDLLLEQAIASACAGALDGRVKPGHDEEIEIAEGN